MKEHAHCDAHCDAKAEPKKEESSTESLAFIVVIMILCLTMVLTTRIYSDTAILGDLVQHYTLRGKDVIVKDDHLVFVN